MMRGVEKTQGSRRAAAARPRGAAQGLEHATVAAGTVRELVDLTERAICGRGAVASAAVAEGLAASGSRAATLLAPRRGRPLHVESMTTAWLHHRVRPEDGVPRGVAFELVAADAQEAIDHSLAAQRAVARLGRPGLCSVDRQLADSLVIARLPRRAAIETALGGSGTRPAAVDGGAAEAVREALAHVGSLTGRRRDVLVAEGIEQAEHVLVAAGAAVIAARALAAELRAREVACGVIAVGLIEPFPSARLAELLGDVSSVLVLGPPGMETNALTDHVRRAVGAAGVEVRCVDAGADASAAVHEALSLGPAGPAAPAGTARAPAAAGGLRIGFAPVGPWGERFLIDLAVRLAAVAQPAIARPTDAPHGTASLWIGAAGSTPARDMRMDLLIVADVTAIAGLRDLDRLLAEQASLVVLNPTDERRIVHRLDRGQREAIAQRDIRIYRLDETDPWDAAAPDARDQLVGAVLTSQPRFGDIVGVDDVIETAPRGDTTADSLRRGAERLRRVVVDLAETPLPVVAAAREPVMPEAGEVPEADRERWQSTLREFHLAGAGTPAAADPREALPLRPAVLAALTGDPNGAGGDAILLGEAPASFARWLDAWLEQRAESGSSLPILAEHRGAVLRVATRLLSERTGAVPVERLLQETLDALPEHFDLSAAGAKQLATEIESLRPHLPPALRALGMNPSTLVTAYADTVRRQRHSRLESFANELRKLSRRLDELLRLDASHGAQGAAPDAVRSGLGKAGDEFVDPVALSTRLPMHGGSRRMDPVRRRRVERAREVLQRHLEDAATLPALIVVAADSDDDVLAEVVDARVIRHADPLRAAVGAFDALAQRAATVFKALRVARLEVAGKYDPQRHDAVLERYDWQAFSEDELRTLPVVVAIESGRRLREQSLAALSELVRGGRPVHVLVGEPTSDLDAAETWDALAGFHPGLGYLSVAHREAFVLQSSLDRPEHLISGLQRMALTLGPAVGLVAVPRWQAAVPSELQLRVAREGRATPCFTYDPAAGETWAERFELTANPQPERRWPVHAVPYREAAGGEARLEEAVTFAHAAALDPAFRAHYRVVPAPGWSASQVGVDEFLDAPARQRGELLPFIWVIDERGILARAVLTREMAYACHDRARAWRILQELAGLNNEHVRRAAATAREAALAEARDERERLRAEHEAELQRVREETAGEAMQRLAAVLMDLDSVPVTPPASLAAAAAAVEAAPAPQPGPAPAEPAAEEPAEEEISFDEPSIDSALCTTCNECTNLNARMFKYNENRQAFIADAAAGTFEELVKAAEKCPARCIHPGAPRAGDPTISDELIARAKPFN